MTVVVAFLCSDGVVVAADSMASQGVFQHATKKVHILDGDQLCGWAGENGQCQRFQYNADQLGKEIPQTNHPMDYANSVSIKVINDFKSTNIQNVDLASFLAFPHGGQPHCCTFINLQPDFFNNHQFYRAIGAGAASAAPFLKQLTDVFCKGQQPALREAVFLAIWAVNYTINTVSGGVGDPIRVAILDQDKAGAWAARELTDNDIREHENAIDAAYDTLKNWRDSFHAEEAAEELPAKPEPPKGGT